MKLLALARRFCVGFAATLVLAGAAPALAEPALWVVRDADSTLYLFGTAHVLRPDVSWRSPKIDKAFAESNELVVEVKQPESPADLQALIGRYGIDPARPLSSRLDAADKARLAAAAQAMGLPAPALEPMRPWFAALTLSLAPIVKAGYDPQSGVEMVLTAQAKAGNKPVAALETMEQQIRFFADMAPEAELAMLRATLADVDDAAAMLDALVAAWVSGDAAALEAAFITEMRRDYAEAYDVLIVRRNEDWADQIVEKLQGSGVSFIAVGAGHLVGPDSVQEKLARRGVRAERF
ncbi:MAG: TraB/GumN family protein [Phenylobacterium sp.]|uniref:TraB/GumN family protein n=1 Tax=Phenylobacterium sp. TaxID=1871053 RepID=UPI00391C8DAF